MVLSRESESWLTGQGMAWVTARLRYTNNPGPSPAARVLAEVEQIAAERDDLRAKVAELAAVVELVRSTAAIWAERDGYTTTDCIDNINAILPPKVTPSAPQAVEQPAEPDEANDAG